MKTCKWGHGEYEDKRRECPACARLRTWLWRENNKERMRATRARWRKANRSKALELTARWKKAEEDFRLAYPRAVLAFKLETAKLKRRPPTAQEVEDFRRAWEEENIRQDIGEDHDTREPS